MSKIFLALSLLLVAMFSLVGCKTEAGKTLEVRWGANLPRSVPVGLAFTDTASIMYKGAKPLAFFLEVVSSSAGVDNVGFSPVSGPASVNGASSTMTFNASGTYVIKMTVYEIGGNISASDEVTYIAGGSSG